MCILEFVRYALSKVPFYHLQFGNPIPHSSVYWVFTKGSPLLGTMSRTGQGESPVNFYGGASPVCLFLCLHVHSQNQY